MKNKKLNLLVLFIMIILVLYFSLKDNFNGVINELSNVNLLIFALAIIMFLLSLFFKSISLFMFIREYNNKYSIKDAFSLTLISQFLNGITPFQSGGQPFEIYLLKKKKIRITDSTNALLKDFISFQVALILMSLFSIFVNLKTKSIEMNNYLTWIILAGFIINFGVLLFLFIFANAKETGKKILNKIIDFAFKFKIVNKLKITKEKAKESVSHFYETSETVKKSKSKILIGTLTNMMYLIILYIIPTLVFMSLGYNKITILNSIVVTSFVMLIGNFVPIPGATGGIEFGFVKLFEVFIKGPILSGAMLMWRTITYFLAMIIGAIALLFERKDT